MTRSTIASVLTLLITLAGCADDGDPAATDDTGSSSSSSTGATGDPATTLDTSTTTDASESSGELTTSSGSTSGDTSTGEPAEPVVEIVVAFDPAAFELPEGLFVAGDEAIVGHAFTGAIERIALADGTRTPLGATPPPPPDTSFVTGITQDTEGRTYAAVVSFTADLQAGIYRTAAEGGDATLWASDPAIVFPNGFAWDDTGRLFVSDSTGPILAIDDAGEVTQWFADEQLLGDPMACDQSAAFTVGPNGIAWTPDALWVASSDRGILGRVAMEKDGTAGALEIVAGPDCTLGGIDGIALEADGTVVAAINRQDKIVRIEDDGTITTIVEGEPLAFPASLDFGDDGALYVTNFSLDDLFAGAKPTPSLARITYD
jgi:sugar lactone lactonase YvrE